MGASLHTVQQRRGGQRRRLLLARRSNGGAPFRLSPGNKPSDASRALRAVTEPAAASLDAVRVAVLSALGDGKHCFTVVTSFRSLRCAPLSLEDAVLASFGMARPHHSLSHSEDPHPTLIQPSSNPHPTLIQPHIACRTPTIDLYFSRIISERAIGASFSLG